MFFVAEPARWWQRLETRVWGNKMLWQVIMLKSWFFISIRSAFSLFSHFNAWPWMIFPLHFMQHWNNQCQESLALVSQTVEKKVRLSDISPFMFLVSPDEWITVLQEHWVAQRSKKSLLPQLQKGYWSVSLTRKIKKVLWMSLEIQHQGTQLKLHPSLYCPLYALLKIVLFVVSCNLIFLHCEGRN